MRHSPQQTNVGMDGRGGAIIRKARPRTLAPPFSPVGRSALTGALKPGHTFDESSSNPRFSALDVVPIPGTKRINYVHKRISRPRPSRSAQTKSFTSLRFSLRTGSWQSGTSPNTRGPSRRRHRETHRGRSHCPKSGARTSSTSRETPPTTTPGSDGVTTTD